MSEEHNQIYSDQMKEIVPLQEGELKELLAKLPDKDASERIISTNLAYVASIAEDYISSNKNIEISDLIQEGNIALMLLVKHYHGGDFYQMLERGVRSAMQGYCDSQKANEEIEEKLTASINVMNQVTAHMAEELGREPSIYEVAEKMKLPEEEVYVLMKTALNAVNYEK